MLLGSDARNLAIRVAISHSIKMLSGLEDPGVIEKVKKSIAMLKRSLALYSEQRIAFSFNGGKDSTVILHLLRACMESCSQPEVKGGSTGELKGIRSFYFVRQDDFEEVDVFVREMDERRVCGVAGRSTCCSADTGDFISSQVLSECGLHHRRGLQARAGERGQQRRGSHRPGNEEVCVARCAMPPHTFTSLLLRTSGVTPTHGTRSSSARAARDGRRLCASTPF